MWLQTTKGKIGKTRRCSHKMESARAGQLRMKIAGRGLRHPVDTSYDDSILTNYPPTQYQIFLLISYKEVIKPKSPQKAGTIPLKQSMEQHCARAKSTHFVRTKLV